MQKRKTKTKKEKRKKFIAFATEKQTNEDYCFFFFRGELDEKRKYIEDACGLVCLHIITHRRQ